MLTFSSSPQSPNEILRSFRFDLATSTTHHNTTNPPLFLTLQVHCQSLSHTNNYFISHHHQLTATIIRTFDTEPGIVSEIALDDIKLGTRQRVFSRAAAVGETFACSSPAYGTITITPPKTSPSTVRFLPPSYHSPFVEPRSTIFDPPFCSPSPF